MPQFYVLLGPPGAGKGTQAAIIAEKCGIPHISSGNIFRENLQNNTDLGKQARVYMDKGELVPDGITIGMVENRLSQPDCKDGALLDGYPRTPTQAQALIEFLKKNGNEINAVPFINVPSNDLVERLSGRWTCKAEGHIYHLKNKPPKQANICDIDGSALYQREDDKRETVEQRIKVYVEQTAPLIAFYKKDGLLFEVDGALPIEQVTDKLLEIVKC
jgi:adenylate kinase